MQIERIELRLLVAEPPIGADQGIDARLAERSRLIRGRSSGRAWPLPAAPGRLLAAQFESGEEAFHWASTLAGSRFHWV